ncbi:ABC transporter ATP-binding protein [Petrotoga sp. 9PWA.NaAc.5.4]|uniref:ABC transporter ATP-binding protein n=1 Tax=Petrotoga sp. 9PWA.NaAc.5.4 TaxID=1434328 RepID=UPI000CB53671|nr:ABC transporter ATP-binding protein [Petrotoga sp. 9PWA.NaAc.5.4]PNR95770.1 peptide ABC transporter ATPase [Petrotoga sp. 9PWA.NaAc.5.4]
MNDEIILSVKNLKKWFPLRRTIKEFFSGDRRWVRAVDGVSFDVKRGEIFSLIGESGCGKTTTGRLIMKLEEATDGEIIFKNENIISFSTLEKIKAYKEQVQMIFQDPYASMNPRFKIRDVLSEPLIIHKKAKTLEERENLVRKTLEEVKLIPPEEFMDRYPHMLSGGQRQRVATARTLILSPELIVADEPVSMIDLSTRAEILHMMKEVQKNLQLTYIYITHDLSTARYFCDRIAVMYLGKIVELGNADEIIENPLHPYTKALIEAVPEPLPGKENQIKEIPIKGEVPSAANVPKGCRFHPRCIYAQPKCYESVEDPELVEDSNGHFVACYRYKEINTVPEKANR